MGPRFFISKSTGRQTDLSRGLHCMMIPSKSFSSVGGARVPSTFFFFSFFFLFRFEETLKMSAVIGTRPDRPPHSRLDTIDPKVNSWRCASAAVQTTSSWLFLCIPACCNVHVLGKIRRLDWNGGWTLEWGGRQNWTAGKQWLWCSLRNQLTNIAMIDCLDDHPAD